MGRRGLHVDSNGGSLSTRDQLKDHEVRLRKMERWMYALPLTLVTSFVAAVAAIVAATK